jgi:hypothetical protein
MLVRGVLNESVALLAIGLLLGIPASLAASVAIRASLFGLNPLTPISMATVSACMMAGI